MSLPAPPEWTALIPRILIADDDPAFVQATAGLLEHAGYQCHCVPDANAALSQLCADPYDLLIADIEMPNNEQMALLRQLPPSAEGMPVILATGFPSLQSAIQAVQLPVVAYLVKPFPAERLLAEVRCALERRRAYLAVRQSDERLQEWSGKIQQIRKVLESRTGPLPMASFMTYSALTLHNIMNLLMDLKLFTEAVAPSSPSLKHIEILCEAVSVLEKTKRSFKSSELAQLRRKLEAHLRATTPAPPVPFTMS